MSDASSGTSRMSAVGLVVRAAASILVVGLILFGLFSARFVLPEGRTVRLNVGPRRILGTLVSVSLVAPAEEESAANEAIEAAFTHIREIDGLMSFYADTSELSRLNKAGTGNVSEDLFRVLAKAQEVSRLTGGAFDVTVRPLIRVWKEAARKDALPTQADLDAARALVSYTHVTLAEGDRKVTLTKQGTTIDLAGIAKGYAVDAASAVLRGKGFGDFMVEAGGEIYCSGSKGPDAPWRIGVRDPR